MFSINTEQQKKINRWFGEQQKVYMKKHKIGVPYYGAIGGELSYHFTPTSLGVVLKITHNGTRETLDATDYEDW